MENRIILHVDLDCFYAQVEILEHPECMEMPVGVQQRSLVVTTNYIARNLGVPKMCSVTEAKNVCPSIVLYPSVMEKYRDASDKFFETLRSFSSKMIVEKSRIDEGYVDLTRLVDEAIETDRADYESSGVDTVPEFKGFVLGDSERDLDIRLRYGSVIADRIRKELHSLLGLTCSGGIAENKLLAKMVAGMNKPMAQTTLRPCYVDTYLQRIDLNHFPQLGPKLQSRLLQLNVKTAADLRAYSLEDLSDHFNASTGKWLYRMTRGLDDAPVTPKGLQKAMSVTSHRRFNSSEEVYDLLKEQSKELFERMTKEMEKKQRFPTAIRLSILSWNSSVTQGIPEQKCLDMRTFKSFREVELLAIAGELFRKLVEKKKGHKRAMRGLSTTICNFKFNPTEGIAKFLVPKEKIVEEERMNEEIAGNDSDEPGEPTELVLKYEKEIPSAKSPKPADKPKPVVESKGKIVFNPQTLIGAMKLATSGNSKGEIQNLQNREAPLSVKRDFDAAPPPMKILSAQKSSYECPICRAQVSVADRQMHEDYHMAVDIANSIERKSFKKEPKRSPDDGSTIGKRKKKNPNNLDKKENGTGKLKKKMIKKEYPFDRTVGGISKYVGEHSDETSTDKMFLKNGDMVCKRCGSRFPDAKSFQSHTDMHLAFDIANTMEK